MLARRRMTMQPAMNLILALETLAPALHSGWL
jgi:hypothetical protein